MTEFISPAPLMASRNGSSHHPAPGLTRPAPVVDLAAEVKALKESASWEHAHNSARTLSRKGRLRVVLTAMRAGAILTEHRTPGEASIQAISGHLRVHLATQTVDLTAGSLIVLDPGAPHTVEALEESAFLLTLVWPSDTAAGH